MRGRLQTPGKCRGVVDTGGRSPHVNWMEVTPSTGKAAQCEPGERKAGVVVPVIERERCEGKAECVAVCPFDVFEVRKLDAADRRTLPFVAKLKAMAHGNRQAYVVKPQDCHACQDCITVCPEGAIDLVAADKA